MKNWTEEEINILKNNYDKVTREELSLMLPGRSMYSISTKLNKLHLSHLEWWSKEEDEILKNIILFFQLMKYCCYYQIEQKKV